MIIPKKWVEQHRKLFEPLINKEVTITFGPHSLTSRFISIAHAPITSLRNKPQRVGDGHVPGCFRLEFSSGKLAFTCEDSEVIVIPDGLKIILKDGSVYLRCKEDSTI